VGVTIHFEGKLKDKDSLTECLGLAKRYSDERQWHFRSIDSPEVSLSRVRDEQDWNYVGPVTGIEIQPHCDSEPLRLEFDRDLNFQDWIKTQFAPIDIHVQVCELFHLLDSFFESFKIEDEGEYFETGDLPLLTKHRDSVSAVIGEYLANPKNYGPFRLASGRIVDLQENA
jgi:hypothetical protein